MQRLTGSYVSIVEPLAPLTPHTGMLKAWELMLTLAPPSGSGEMSWKWIWVRGAVPPEGLAHPSRRILTAWPVTGALGCPLARPTFQSAVSAPQWLVWKIPFGASGFGGTGV